MNSQELISIIIPSYNTKYKYIEKCINSILEQNYYNFEIIIVDDGSEIQYKKGLKKIEEKDSRIRILYNEHAGVSIARNAGISAAVGNYVAFVDADDVVIPVFLENAMSYARKYNYPDLIIGGLQYEPYRKCNDTQYGSKCELFEGEEVHLLKKSLMHIKDEMVNYYILGTPCGRLYKTSIAQKALFPDGVALCEDQIFNRRFLLNTRRAIVIPQMWYKYIQNESSVMHTKARKNFYGMLKLYWDELEKLDELETMKDIDGMRGFYIRSFYNMVGIYHEYDTKIRNEIIEEALKHPLIEKAIVALDLKSNITLDRKIEWFILKTRNLKLINILAGILK